MPVTSKKPLKTLSQVTKRFNQVRAEFNKTQPYKQKAVQYFAKALGISSTNCYRFIHGDADPNKEAIDGIASLGYSVEWLLTGIGEKKPEERKRTTIHDFKAIEVEINKYRNEMNAMRIRMKAYEDEQAKLLRLINELTQNDSHIHGNR